MDLLNYHHLRYFWAVAKEGSVAAAAKRLRVTQPTISGQIRALESVLGHRLFERSGRGLALTDAGRLVFRFADDIFEIGSELLDAVRGRSPRGRLRLNIGIADVLPKLVVYRLLLPVLTMRETPHLMCFEGKPPDLMSRLAAHELDVVLTDTPVSPVVKAFSHRLGESGLAVFGSLPLARRIRAGFPESLHGAPMVLPTPNTVLRRRLDLWFDRTGIRPDIRGEFEDSALLKVFGQSGIGLFVAPGVIASEVRSQYNVSLIGWIPGVREEFYAVSMERRIKHPAVAMLTDAARQRLLAKEGGDAGTRRKASKIVR